jgi:hypothetical protein
MEAREKCLAAGAPPNLVRRDVVHLGRGDVWKTSPHPNPEKYPHQSIAFVVVDEYIFLVPFDVAGDVIHLRTIIPSRKATRQYMQEKRRRP